MERTGKWERQPGGPEARPARPIDSPIEAGVDRIETGAGPAPPAEHEHEAESSVRERTERAKELAKDKGAELKETAGRKAEELKDRAVRKTDELTSRAGSRMETVARALRRAGDDMRNEGEAHIADMTDRAASRVERFGSYLGGRNPHAMMEDLERSAREHPAYFVAGSFAVGLLLGRFLRASEPNPFEEAR